MEIDKFYNDACCEAEIDPKNYENSTDSQSHNYNQQSPKSHNMQQEGDNLDGGIAFE